MNEETKVVKRGRDYWNKCQVCGQFIPYRDLRKQIAVHLMKTPDSEYSKETWETLCKKHRN